MVDKIEFEPEFDEEVDFDADEDLEEALGYRGRIDVDELKARGREMLSSARERGRERFYEAATRGKERMADALDNTATRLDDRLYGGAEYLRSSDIDSIGRDLAEQVRNHPFISVGLALGAGYVVGKAMNVGRGPGRSMVRRHIGKQLRRAVVSSLAAAVAASMRERFAPEAEVAPAGRPRRPKARD